LYVEYTTTPNGLTINQAQPGTYTLVVENENGCVTTTEYTVAAKTPITLTGNVTKTTSGTTTTACNLDMSSLSHGEVITNQFASQGISISVNSNGSYADELIIFDTDKSNTADDDLEVNIGNILIFPENQVDNNNDGLYDSPDDQTVGGSVTFTFSSVRTVKSFVFVDSENNYGRAKCYDANNNLLSTKTIVSAGNKSVQTVNVNTANVKKIVISWTQCSACILFVK